MGALLIALWVSAGVAFIIFNLVRLNLYHRQEELTILRAVGATRRFIYGPLIVESALQVQAATFAAFALIDGLFTLLRFELGEELELMGIPLLTLTLSQRISLALLLALLAGLAAYRAARPAFSGGR